MANLASIVRQLKVERNQAQRRLEQLDQALGPLAVSADCVEAGVVAGDWSGHGEECRRLPAGESPPPSVPAAKWRASKRGKKS